MTLNRAATTLTGADPATYDASYTIPEDVDPNFAYELPENGTLETIVAECVANGVDVTLYNDNGSVGGYVKSDGNWSLR